MTERDSEARQKDIENRILTILSMNGRATLNFVGKSVGLSKHPTYRRIRQIETEVRDKVLG